MRPPEQDLNTRCLSPINREYSIQCGETVLRKPQNVTPVQTQTRAQNVFMCVRVLKSSVCDAFLLRFVVSICWSQSEEFQPLLEWPHPRQAWLSPWLQRQWVHTHTSSFFWFYDLHNIVHWHKTLMHRSLFSNHIFPGFYMALKQLWKKWKTIQIFSQSVFLDVLWSLQSGVCCFSIKSKLRSDKVKNYYTKNICITSPNYMYKYLLKTLKWCLKWSQKIKRPFQNTLQFFWICKYVFN